MSRGIYICQARNTKRLSTHYYVKHLIDQDIAGFLEEHSARVSDDERRAIDEAVSISVAQKIRCV